jgi:hypothetical protein
VVFRDELPIPATDVEGISRQDMMEFEAFCTSSSVASLWIGTLILAVHSFTPPHTPQLSNSTDPQHLPAADKGDRQQTPMESTATPDPLQFPQASRVPEQQRPSREITSEEPQHRPVTTSTSFKQHLPKMSTIPTHTPSVEKSGMSQDGPVQPSLHSHLRLDNTHRLFVMRAVQSVSTLHSQGIPVSHSTDDAGRSPAAHKLSDTTAPELFTQTTIRVLLPKPHPFELLQLPHEDVDHLAATEGQSKRLQGISSMGFGCPADTQTDA